MYYRFFERGLVGSYETDGTIALEEYYNESPETWTPEEDTILPGSFCLACLIAWTEPENLRSMYGKFKTPVPK